MVGPLPKTAAPMAHISRFGVIPKAHQPNKWRLIVDLSHPKGGSVNDGIPRDLCSMSYITVDEAIEAVLKLGRGTLLAKIDIKNAFRLIPVHPAIRHRLAMEWNDSIFIDTCLPFGLPSAPKLFNILSDLLEWILQRQGVTFLLHYLDDFLTIGPPRSPACQNNLELLVQVSKMLGIPLATEKVEGPDTALEFMGIVLDTTRMEVRLPEDKLARIRTTIHEWLNRKCATKREILSLVGILQHAAKVVRPGRTFVHRMYSVAAKVPELEYYTQLNKAFCSNLFWWHTFIGGWNGVSFLQVTNPSPPAEAIVQTDASGHCECGAVFHTQWLQWQWTGEWAPITIMAKELVPIMLSCAVWGPRLAHKKVLFQCDNTGVVAAIRKGSAKEELVMHLLRALWFFVAHYDIAISIEHIVGSQNCAADQVSRGNMQSFFLSNPQANLLPTPLPAELQRIIAVTGPDWTSRPFNQLFSTTISKV